MTSHRRPRSAVLGLVLLATSGALVACGGATADRDLADDPAAQVTAPPIEQWGERMTECLAGRGWDVQLEVDGGLSAYGIADPEEYDADFEACEAEHGYHLPQRPLTPTEAEQKWDELLATADCMRDLGFEVADRKSVV